MVKDAKSLHRNWLPVVGGNLFQHTTLGDIYETRNLGTKYRPHWVITDDKGELLWVSNRSYRQLFQPIYVDAEPVPEKPEVIEGDLAYLWKS